MLDRKKPAWSSRNEVVIDSGFAALRDFSDGSRSRVVPTVVLPPQAGHHSCIVDYSRDQSQIQTIKAAGLTRVGRLTVAAETLRGFSVLLWRDRGLGYALISDVNRSDLEALAGRINPD